MDGEAECLIHWDTECRWRREGEGWVLGAWEWHIRGEPPCAEEWNVKAIGLQVMLSSLVTVAHLGRKRDEGGSQGNARLPGWELRKCDQELEACVEAWLDGHPSSQPCLSSAAMTKCYRLGHFNNIYSSQFWGLEAQDQGSSRLGVRREPTPGSKRAVFSDVLTRG